MANVLRQVKIDGKWKLLPVAKVGDRLDWTKVMLAGKPIVSLEGTFFLEYREGGKRVRRAVGSHMREAKLALATQTGVLELRAKGIDVPDALQIRARRPVEGKTIRAVVDQFCATPPISLRKRTVLTYGLALRNFAEWSKKTHVSQLDRDDIEGFMAHQVRKEKLAIRTARDRAVNVLSIFNRNGASIVMLKGALPRVTEAEPEVYTPEVLKVLFAKARRAEFVLYQTFLMTGMREREVMFLSWDDFSALRSTLRVTKKPALGFDPKTYEERTVPIPAVLNELLQEHRRERDGSAFLLFPTSKHNVRKGQPGGMPDGHMLRRLKNLAMKAGLNCGMCQTKKAAAVVSCRTHPVCSRFYLHRFRHTYATTLLRDGVDLVSVQKLLGHKDVASTRRYLHALDSEDLLAKINSTSLATQFV